MEVQKREYKNIGYMNEIGKAPSYERYSSDLNGGNKEESRILPGLRLSDNK